VSHDERRWYEPGVYPVAPGIHRIPLPLPGEILRAVNIYVLDSYDGPVLVDVGWSVVAAREALRAGLAELGFALGDVRRALITHMHMDHYTLGVMLRRMFGTSVEIGVGECPSLIAVAAGTRTLAQRLAPWGAAELLAVLPPEGHPEDEYELPDRWIEDGATIELGARRLLALPTPGHTRGHVVFADFEAGLVFSGDHILPSITPSIGLEPARNDLCLADFLDSLDLIMTLPDLDVLPAHGPLGSRSHARAAELREHHERRLELSRRAVAADGASAYDVARRLPWTRHERALEELDVMNQYMAIGETAAHLDLLVSRGTLLRNDGEVRVYRLMSAEAP
jgi:glyoxylase-like metal-dependent hydrolase (beta-lactamase superfamily II)